MLRLVQLYAVVRKEVRQTLRDRRLVAMLIVAPLLQLVVFANAVDFEVDRVPTVIVDRDDTIASRAHASRLLADGTLRLVASTPDEAEALAMLDEGDAAVAVMLREGTSRALARGRPAPVQVVLDGTDPTRAGYAAAAVGRYFSEAAVPRDVRGAPVIPRVLYNPTMATSAYMVPGIAAMVLLLVTTIIAAMGLARERETGTYEQIAVTPIPPWVLLLGKTLPFVAIGLMDFWLALGVGATFFGMPIRGSLVLLMLATMAYLLTTLGIGLLISTVSRSQQQAFLGGFLFLLPALLLSGNLTPVAAMPGWMQVLTLANPLRYYLHVARAILLKGATLGELLPEITSLAAFGVTIFTLATLRFRKQLG